MSGLTDCLKTASVVLADGGIETRLIYEFHRPLPDFASFLAPFDAEGRAALSPIYCLPDDTPLGDMVARIEAGATPGPLHFLIGCVHPTRFSAAMAAPAWPMSDRVVGLKANASTLPPEVLDKLDHLEEGKPEVFAALMAGLHADGQKVLGGCCGTSDTHIRALARRLTTR